MQRLPLAKYSAFSIVMWGVTLSCFAAVEKYSGAIAVRLFLGAFEASVTPAFAFFTSQVGRIRPNRMLHLIEPVVHKA